MLIILAYPSVLSIFQTVQFIFRQEQNLCLNGKDFVIVCFFKNLLFIPDRNPPEFYFKEVCFLAKRFELQSEERNYNLSSSVVLWCPEYSIRLLLWWFFMCLFCKGVIVRLVRLKVFDLPPAWIRQKLLLVALIH